MSLPDAIIITQDPALLLHHLGFPFGLALVPGNDLLPDRGLRSVWLIDADCAMRTLNDPAFGDALERRIPVTIHSEKLRDLRAFLRRRAEFKRRGYRIDLLPAPAQ